MSKSFEEMLSSNFGAVNFGRKPVVSISPQADLCVQILVNSILPGFSFRSRKNESLTVIAAQQLASAHFSERDLEVFLEISGLPQDLQDLIRSQKKVTRRVLIPGRSLDETRLDDEFAEDIRHLFALPKNFHTKKARKRKL